MLLLKEMIYFSLLYSIFKYIGYYLFVIYFNCYICLVFFIEGIKYLNIIF